MHKDEPIDETSDNSTITLDDLDHLVDNIEQIQKIEQLLGGGFNFFTAAGMGTSEIKHCRFLAFLLNPRGAHLAGDLFLRALLMECVSDPRVDMKGIRKTDVYLRDLSQAIVRTEVYTDNAGRIDVVIDIPSMGNAKRWIILIEAKINAIEGNNQTKRYVEWARNEYDSSLCNSTYLYLTKDQGISESSDFQSISWDIVSQALGIVLDEYRSKLPNDTLVSVQHYLNLMKEKDIVMQNEEKARAKLLAQQLYETHKRAFAFIYQIAAAADDPIANALKSALSQIEEFDVDADSHSTIVRIYPKIIEEIKGVTLDKPWTRACRPIYIEVFFNNPKRCYIALVVGPLADKDMRNNLITTLAKILPKEKRPLKLDKFSSFYTRVWSVGASFSDDANEAPPEYAQAVCKLLMKSPLFTKIPEWTEAVKDIFVEKKDI